MNFILVIDTEFSGPNFFKNGLVSIGAVLYSYSYTNLKLEKEFYEEMNLLENQVFDENTINEFWNSSTLLFNLYVKIKEGKANKPKNSIENFVKFLFECDLISNSKMCICGDRIDIDFTWLNLYLTKFDFKPMHLILNRFIRPIDTSSYHQGLCKTKSNDIENIEKDLKITSYNPTEAALQYLGIKTRPKIKYDHNALNDAKYIAETHILILQKIIKYPYPKQQHLIPLTKKTHLASLNNRNNYYEQQPNYYHPYFLPNPNLFQYSPSVYIYPNAFQEEKQTNYVYQQQKK